jgi:hypothetical protein
LSKGFEKLPNSSSRFLESPLEKKKTPESSETSRSNHQKLKNKSSIEGIQVLERPAVVSKVKLVPRLGRKKT